MSSDIQVDLLCMLTQNESNEQVELAAFTGRYCSLDVDGTAGWW